MLAAQYWDGGYRIEIGDELTGVTIAAGHVVEQIPESGPGVITLAGPDEVWEPMLRTVPPRLANTVSVMVGNGLTLPGQRRGGRMARISYVPVGRASAQAAPRQGDTVGLAPHCIMVAQQ